jgi:hypothetical protein
MILKSYIQYRVSSSVDPVDSTVHVDDVTISGDGSESSPLQIKTGYLGTAALEDTSAFDAAGAADAAQSAANSYTDSGLSEKQNTLVSGTNIKTINGTSVLGSGDLEIDGSKVIQFAASDETTPLTTGTGKITFRMPYAMTLTAVRISLTTAQTSGSILTVDINVNGSSILSTKLTIDNGEKTSVTAAIQAVISNANISDDAEVSLDIDGLGDGTAAGLKGALIGE